MNRIYGTDGNVYETSISNGKEYTKKEKEEFAIAELERIKLEIHKLAFDDNDKEYIGVIDNDDVMDLIDKRIDELKGSDEK